MVPGLQVVILSFLLIRKVCFELRNGTGQTEFRPYVGTFGSNDRH
jgi:hypothetical protein